MLLSGHLRLSTLHRSLEQGRFSATHASAAARRAGFEVGAGTDVESIQTLIPIPSESQLDTVLPAVMGPWSGLVVHQGKRHLDPPVFLPRAAPSREALGLVSPVVDKAWPLHIKETSLIDFSALLACAPPSLISDLRKCISLLLDSQIFRQLPLSSRSLTNTTSFFPLRI